MERGTKIIIGILVAIAVLGILVDNYKYNNCVRTNTEELVKCLRGEFGNYDCSEFENADEMCNAILEFKYQ